MNAPNNLVTHPLRVPPGPAAPYDPSESLFAWINDNFIRYGDIYKGSVFGGDVYVVSAPEYAERILRLNWQNYSRNGQVVKRIALLLGNGLIASNGRFWKNQRQMIQPAFSKNSIAALQHIIVTANAELRDSWVLAAARQEPVNVTRDVSAMVLAVTLRAIFGEDYDEAAPHFRMLVEAPARDFEFAGAFRPLGRIIHEIVLRRRRDGVAAADFLGRLMAARDREHGQPMPDAQLVREIMTLIVAGHETTASLLNWMWYLLSRHPEAQGRLSDEFDRLPWENIPELSSLAKYVYTLRVIDEALRLYPPLWLMTRKALKDDYVGEFYIPAGAEIYISPYLIQRSPRLWDAPDDFQPDRWSAANSSDRHELALCPFGAGPRNCIGEAFARLEIQCHLMIIARDLRLVYQNDKASVLTTGMNLLSRDDFMMLPERKR
jgi:cytochrome P450